MDLCSEPYKFGISSEFHLIPELSHLAPIGDEVNDPVNMFKQPTIDSLLLMIKVTEKSQTIISIKSLKRVNHFLKKI